MSHIKGLIVVIATASLLLACDSKSDQGERKPNIILILVDDLGYDDLGIRNTAINTPHLDQLSKESVVFNQFYVNPVCAPSRASLLTGRHFLRTGVSHVHGGKDFIHLSETLLPQALKTNGYVTGMWGKWHSGHSLGYFPWERGFDEAYMANLYQHQNNAGLYNGNEVKHEKWADEVIVDYAIDFISRNKDTTFFAFLPSLSPHAPIKTPQELIDQYVAAGHSENLSALYAMIEFMDAQIGRLLNHLDELGLTENTVIIFLSDNGPQISSNFLTKEERNQRYVSNLKGHKGNIWENGVKSPLFIKWKGKYLPNQVNNLADITDLFPTLISMAGGKTPESQLPLDGHSLVPFLQGNKQLPGEKISYNYAHVGWAPTDDRSYSLDGVPHEYDPILKDTLDLQKQTIAIRKDEYKLLLNAQLTEGVDEASAKLALYNIIEDPTESHNLYQAYPEKVNELQSLVFEWFNSIKQESHAFEMPVFIIEKAQPHASRVFAKAAINFHESMGSSALELKHWKTNENFAEYLIDVKTAGIYYPIAVYRKPTCRTDGQLILEIGDQRIKALLNGDTETQLPPIELPMGRSMMKISIQAGENQRCDTLLYSLRHILFN